MKYTRESIFIFFLLVTMYGHGQKTWEPGDTVQYEYSICKLPVMFSSQGRLSLQSNYISYSAEKKILLTASGGISYQYFSRDASSDNLLLINSASDIATLRLSLVYKEVYPFSFSLRYNKSRPFQTDNQYEINIGHDEREFREILKEKITRQAKNKFLQQETRLLANYHDVFQQFQEKKQLLESPAYAQEIVQQRLQNRVPAMISNLPGPNDPVFPASSLPSLLSSDAIKERIKDSIEQLFNKRIEERFEARLQEKKDSLLQLLKGLEDSLVIHKDSYRTQLDSLNRELSEISSSGKLKKYAASKGVQDSLSGNKWAAALMKTNLQFGKFILNSSELTVSNIFLHGLSVKYGDEKFIIVSGGSYDFAFREQFNFRNDTLKKSNQSVLAVKIGRTDGQRLSAVNLYVGRKLKAASVNGELRTIAGISVERKYSLNRNVTAEFELAKSTTRVNSVSDKEQPVLKDLFTRYNTRTIGVFSALKAYLPGTKTDVAIQYCYWGQQFESFNANQYFNPQNNLSGKISQPLFKRKLFLNAGLRYTDFKSYGVANNIKTKTFFATANATLRIKKLPIISLGYYPGSQLYWLDQSRLYEYYYYILNATASHYFAVGKMPMQLVSTYNKFFNKYTDSLVAGSQSYYNLFWTGWINKFSLQANCSRQESEEHILLTSEAGLNYSTDIIRIGGTIKWNIIERNTRLGYSFTTGLSLGKWGTINFIYDYSFLPDRSGKFIPVKTGQIQFSKPLKFSIWQKG